MTREQIADQHRRFLWDLLDNIDTLDDACKDNDKAFRDAARKQQRRRYEISSSDGYEVTFKDDDAMPAPVWRDMDSAPEIPAVRDASFIDKLEEKYGKLSARERDLVKRSKAKGWLEHADQRGPKPFETVVAQLEYEMASMLEDELFQGTLSAENSVKNNRETLNRIARSALVDALTTTPHPEQPEQGASIKPLDYVHAEGTTITEMREHFSKTDIYQRGDARLVWVNEGDLFLLEFQAQLEEKPEHPEQPEPIREAQQDVVEYVIRKGDAGLFHLYGSDGVFISRHTVQGCIDALPAVRSAYERALEGGA